MFLSHYTWEFPLQVYMYAYLNYMMNYFQFLNFDLSINFGELYFKTS